MSRSRRSTCRDCTEHVEATRLIEGRCVFCDEWSRLMAGRLLLDPGEWIGGEWRPLEDL